MFTIVSQGSWYRGGYGTYEGWVQVRISTVSSLGEPGRILRTFEARADTPDAALDAAMLKLTAWLLENSTTVV